MKTNAASSVDVESHPLSVMQSAGCDTRGFERQGAFPMNTQKRE